MGRGQLTEEINNMAKSFLGREITTTELRLYPYLDFVMKNEQHIDPRKINAEETVILSTLRKEGHISGGASGMSMTKEFYDYIQGIIWLGYVIG